MKLRVPRIYDSLKDPFVAGIYLVFALVALLFSVLNFIQALAY